MSTRRPPAVDPAALQDTRVRFHPGFVAALKKAARQPDKRPRSVRKRRVVRR